MTSDHGVATISRSEIDRERHRTAAESARHDYLGPDGTIDTLKGTLPFGFLALDLAYDLQLNLFDPDRRAPGSRLYRRLRLGSADGSTLTTWEHPLLGNGFLSAAAPKADGTDARVIVAANGGSDLICVPDGNPETVASRRPSADLRLRERRLRRRQVRDVPGALPLSAINLMGSSKVPRPAIGVAFKVFYRTPGDLQSAIQISDAVLQDGQGMHGGFGRDSTYNNMAAIGPDFKPRSIDPAPVGNADIAPTLAHLLEFAPTNTYRSAVAWWPRRLPGAALPQWVWFTRCARRRPTASRRSSCIRSSAASAIWTKAASFLPTRATRTPVSRRSQM